MISANLFHGVIVNVLVFIGRPLRQPPVYNLQVHAVIPAEEGVFNAIWDLVDGEGSREDRR